MYINHIGIYDDAAAIQAALDAGTLGKPYVALNTSAGTLDYNTQSPTPVESRLKITYNFETTDETLVLTNMKALFHDAPGKAEFPDGTEFNYNPDGEYESYDIKYTPSTPGIASIYYTFSGDTIGSTIDSDEYHARLLYSKESGEPVPVISFEIPDQVNTIGKLAFSEAEYSAITIPNHSLTIGYGAFYSNFYVVGRLVSINNGENTIPSGSVLCGATFYGQDELGEITIGQGVTFGLGANEDEGDFWNCHSLSSITFLDTTPPSIDANVLDWSIEPLNIYVPVGYEQAYASSFTQDYHDRNPYDYVEIAFRYVSPGIIEAYETQQ